MHRLTDEYKGAEKKYNCKVIQDLLPLYTDGICSDVSAQMVEEHLKECASCEKIAKELQDDSVEKHLGKSVTMWCYPMRKK